MLGFLKKKKTAASQPQPAEEDFNPLDAASVIGYIKQQKPGISDEEIVEAFSKLAAPADDLDHLDEEGELPWGWHYANKDTTDKLNEEYINHPTYKKWSATYKGNPQEEVDALKNYLHYIEEIQNRCNQINECFGFWCSVILIGEGRKEWLEGRLADLEANMDAHMQEYEEKLKMQAYRAELEAYEATLTDEMMFDAIRQHEGMLQKDLCKLFPYPKAISSKLYYMEKDGKIERIKSGNSYILKVK